MSKNPLEKQILAWSEEQLQTEIRKAARQMGWLEYHTYDSRRSTPGFPDLVLVHPEKGLTIFRELKTEKGKPTPSQETWIDALAAAGNDVGVWRPRDWAAGRVQRTLAHGVTSAPPEVR